jgi:hypothetical protein
MMKQAHTAEKLLSQYRVHEAVRLLYKQMRVDKGAQWDSSFVRAVQAVDRMMWAGMFAAYVAAPAEGEKFFTVEECGPQR